MGKPQKVRRFGYISRAADTFLKSPSGEISTHIHWEQERWQGSSSFSCTANPSPSLPVCLRWFSLTQIIKSPNQIPLATMLAKPQRRSEAVKSPQKVVRMAFSVDRKCWERLKKTLRVTKWKKMQAAGFPGGCRFSRQRYPSHHARLPRADCICTATSQQPAFFQFIFTLNYMFSGVDFRGR